MQQNSFDNNNNHDKSCNSSQDQNKNIDFSEQWNKVFNNSPEEKLGWYESEHNATLKLIAQTGLNKSASILIAGAGSTTLIDKLLELGYKNLIASDISEVALNNLKRRVKNKNITYIIDDLTHPDLLKNIPPVDLWIDRAVLHFFTEPQDQNTYFNLLNIKINQNGYVLIAAFNLQGASACAGLQIQKYSKDILVSKLGNNFKLIDHFDHTYITPNGSKRLYIYTLFQNKSINLN